MIEQEGMTLKFNKISYLSRVPKPKMHLDEAAVLLYVDKLMANKLTSEREVKHLEECRSCKIKVLRYLNYYGFDELELR